eukprot:108190-Chlamydomonas_euryale.AAC.3
MAKVTAPIKRSLPEAAAPAAGRATRMRRCDNTAHPSKLARSRNAAAPGAPAPESRRHRQGTCARRMHMGAHITKRCVHYDVTTQSIGIQRKSGRTCIRKHRGRSAAGKKVVGLCCSRDRGGGKGEVALVASGIQHIYTERSVPNMTYSNEPALLGGGRTCTAPRPRPRRPPPLGNSCKHRCRNVDPDNGRHVAVTGRC